MNRMIAFAFLGLMLVAGSATAVTRFAAARTVMRAPV
jgi:hypothetical protein